uniref:Odorant receptor n=1 Tax=Glossina morsitans morsitans TaxID=37546 RepID=A0A1B0GFW7_GLOMM
MPDKKCAKFLSIQQRNLAVLGFDLNAAERRYLVEKPLKLLFVLSCNFYWTYGLMNFAIYNIENFDEITGSLSVFNQDILLFFKMFIFFAKADKYLNLIKSMNKLADKAKNQEYDEWMSENRLAELIAKVYSYTCRVAVAFSATVPLIYSVYVTYTAGELKLKLPVKARFTLDGKLSYFAFNYITFVIHLNSMASLTVGLDSLYFWFIYNISAHFRILRKKLEIMAVNLKTNLQYSIQDDLGAIVVYHLEVIRFIKSMNEIFGEILWAEVTMSCLQMCFATHALMSDVDVSNAPFNIVVVFAVIIQLAIYCFGGEKIREESISLCSDVYLLFPWHKMSMHQRRLMLLPLLRAQKEAYLKGLFFQVDRNLFVFVSKRIRSVTLIPVGFA